MMNKIKVIENQPEKLCRCGSWLNHWNKFSQSKIRMCVVDGCMGIDIEGSHVQLTNSENKEIYIVPLCSVHRSGTEILSIIDSCKLVSSDIGKTCGVEGSKYLKEDEL